MWSLRRSGSSIMSSSDYDSSQGSIQVSSETSTVPSRLDSFSSSNEAAPCNDFNMQTSFDYDDNPAGISTSPISSASSHDKHGGIQQALEVTSTTNSTTDQSTADTTEIAELDSVEAERAVSPTIQKWVDESCAETERLKSAAKFSDDVAIKDEEIDGEEVSPPSDFALQQALEYSLQAVSPSFARTASLDAGFSSLGDYQSQFTPTENMLLGLGFGGPDLGIPVRFLKSWREQVIKCKIMELQGLLERSRKSPSPTGSARQYAVKSPGGGESPRKSQTAGEGVSSPDKKATQIASQSVPSPKTVVKPSQKQLQLEKLNQMRQKLRKSATISSFSPSLLLDPNQLFSGKDMKKKGAMSEKKHQKFRGATRGNAKDRRRKFGTRQSSLPISLETLPEEDEGRPAFLQQKSSSFDFVDKIASSTNTSTTTSVNSSKLDVNYDGTEDNVEEGIHQVERCHKNHPTIVMSEPSDDPDQRLVLIPETEKNQERENSKTAFDGKHLLAIKGIIESKDSGLGNEISNEGTPQLSPEHCSKKSEVQNGKDESGSQKPPENKELCFDRLDPGGDSSTILSKSTDDGSKTKTEKKEDKKQKQRVDLCIQVDLHDIISEDDSDVEYSSAGVQTSPWLESGELSPLCCGHFTNNLNESAGDPSEATHSHEREVNVEDGSYHAPASAPGDSLSQGHEGSGQEPVDTDQENTIQGMKTSEYPIIEGENILSEPCDDVISSDPKRDSSDKSLSVKEPDFFDGFNGEKRRLSRIEEVTESTLSHQSEEERTKNSFESQPDSSSQATSTSSSSRPSSSLIFLGTDALKLSDDTADVNSFKRAQSHSKKIMKQIYNEMLERNLAGDLSNEKDLLHLRTSFQAERCSTKLTVDETLLQAAQKLEMCAREQGRGDFEEAAVGDDNTSLTKVEEKETESMPSRETVPVNPPVSQPEDSLTLQPHLKSISCSPNDQSGSQQSRRFFSSQSFSSFTDTIKEASRSQTNSDTSDATNDFEGDSFFSVPVDLDVLEQEPDVNFSLTGSDMNLMSADGVNRHITHNPQVASRTDTIQDDFSLEELDNYLEENENRRHLKDFLHGYRGDHYNNMISTISSVESGAFFSETINDEVFLGKEVFTQNLEINVTRPRSEDAVFLSHQSISLSHKDCDKGLNRSQPILQEKLSSTDKVPFNYSSKYYFTVEDYSQCSDKDSKNLINPSDQLFRRRQSLINAHLAARGHVFDEIIDEANLYELENGREDHLPSIIVPREEETTGQEVRDTLMIRSFGGDNGVVRNGIAEFTVESKGYGRVEKVAIYGRGRGGSDKMSGDSDVSLGSSIISSKVDRYVDKILENALEEVRSEEITLGGADCVVHDTLSDGEDKEDGVSLNNFYKVTGNHNNQFSWNQMENGKKPHSDPDFNGQIKISVSQNCNSYNPVSQLNQRIDMGYGVLDDRIDHMVSPECALKPVALDGMGQEPLEPISTLNDKFVSLKIKKGTEKMPSEIITLNGMNVQSLNNGMGVRKHSEERLPMSSDEISDLSHNSSVDCSDENNKTKSSLNTSHSMCDKNDRKVDSEHDCHKAIISIGLSERRSVNNGLYCQEIRGNLDINQKEDSLNSGDKTLKALAKSSELMPSYEELYSKAENLISNLDALITGNK